jgi:hypothetical protein
MSTQTQDSSITSARPAIYSPFWALFGVFVTLTVLQGVYLIEDYREHSRIRAAATEAKRQLAQAQVITKTAEEVGKDLLALAAAKSPEADKIIAEFSIRMKGKP